MNPIQHPFVECNYLIGCIQCQLQDFVGCTMSENGYAKYMDND